MSCASLHLVCYVCVVVFFTNGKDASYSKYKDFLQREIVKCAFMFVHNFVNVFEIYIQRAG